MTGSNRHLLIPLLFLFGIVMLLAACVEAPTSPSSPIEDQAAPTGEEAIETTPIPEPDDDLVESQEELEPDPPATKEDPHPTGRIAFINQNGQLATMDPEGRDQRVLSQGSTVFQFPAWSPVSQSIAVIGSNRSQAGIYIFEDSDDSEGLEIYSHAENAPIYLYWTPDGRFVSFIARSDEGLAFHLVPADGSTKGEILTTGQPFYWQWLPNNRQALIHAGSDRLSFLDLDGQETSTGLGKNGIFQAPAVSPDLQYFAYQQASSRGRTIQIKNLPRDEIAYEAAHQGVLAMAWNPQAIQLAFTNPASANSFFGPLLLWEEGSESAATLVNEDVISFFWAPNGRHIAFFTLADLSQQTHTNKFRRSRPVQQNRPFLTLGIVDLETRAVRYLTRFQPPRLIITQFIPFFDQYAQSHRLWSPDSKSIVLSAISNENVPEILVVSIDGQLSRSIGEGVSAFWSQQEK